jgi:hypothetical protein
MVLADEVQKLIELDSSIFVLIDAVDHPLDFFLFGLIPELFHDR